jgi:S1-C subfamily serine protease
MLRCGTKGTVIMVVVGLLSMGVSGAADATAVDHDTGELQVRVVLVTSDLSLKPVPKRRFLIVPDAGEKEPIRVTTDFQGEIVTSLPSGRYRLRAEAPVEFEEQFFSWDVELEIIAGGETSVELSNDNAVIEDASRGLTDEGALYRENKDGVFKIISDAGHGSGFLVSAEGLIFTNYHVVIDAEYLAVKLDERHKHEASLVAEDPAHDLAVLRVHPETVQGRPVLELADDTADDPPVAVGDEVLAIGSPLTTETILTSGLVSKVEDEAIYRDVNINPGNSGGPLFDSRGRVIGINTFGLQAQTGPGVSGITRIYLARPILAEAHEKAAATEPPSARLLPVESTYRFSPEAVKEMALATDREIEDYHLEAGKLDVHLITPVLMASAVIRTERQAVEGRKKSRKKKNAQTEEKPYEPGKRFYEWQQDSDNFRPVVRVRAYPEVKVKAGSVFKSLGMSAKYKFKTDFLRMELRRDGETVEPIHPGRIKEVVDVQQGTASLTDVGYWGYYEYPPEAFAPGAALTLHVWEQDVPGSQTLPLPEAMVARIRDDLRPYFDDRETRDGATP